MRKKLVKIMVFIGFSVLIAFFYMGEVSKKTEPEIGIVNEALKPCGEKPNCVSSFNAPSDSHYVKPMPSDMERLTGVADLLTSLKFEVITQQDDYIYATQKSAIFGFVDDVELLLKDGFIHFRSSSRIGHSDLGANRKRVEKIKFHIAQDL